MEIREVRDKRQLREFIYLPRRLYADWPQWVPPLYADEFNFHDPRHNEALSYSDTVRFILYRDGKPVGRIMGIINRRYNEQHGESAARFFNFDCLNDVGMARTLVNAVEQWARSKSMTRMIGPYGFSDKDPQGLQVEGFENLAVIATPVNPPYLQALIEGLGYTKETECVSYRFDIPAVLPPLFNRIYERLQANPNVRLVEFTSRKQLKPYIVPVFRLVNETYAPLFGFVPMSEKEIQKFAAQYLPILDPAFVKVIVNAGNEVISFIVAMPDMSRGMQKAGGKLFPIGFIYILRAMSKSKQLNLLLGAVGERYRSMGLTVLLATSLFATARKRGLTFVDSHLVLETNKRMRAECEHVGGVIYKRYRIYQKSLV